MEVLSSAFPSSTPASIQLDNIIFYPGPPSEKRCGSALTEADAWPDTDEVLAEAQQDWRYSTQQLDLILDSGVMNEGETQDGYLCSISMLNTRYYR